MTDATDGTDVADLALADPDLSLDSIPEGRVLKAQFIEMFGTWFSSDFRPLLRRVHAAGGEPQLLVNDLAALMSHVADSIVVDVAERDLEVDPDADDPDADDPDPGDAG